MCRMIAAAGRVEMIEAVRATKAMASNLNPDYDHELRYKGDELVHDCGWGIAYRSGSRLIAKRRAVSCLEDREFDELARIETDLLVMHARRAKDRNTISEVNTHPFTTTFNGREYAFCHNGEVRDTSQLEYESAFTPTGGTDSELLFYHVLSRLDTAARADSLRRTLADLTDFTSLNCLLMNQTSIIAAARRDPASELSRYYTLWHGTADGLSVVSSEIVGDLNCDRWEPFSEGEVRSLSAV